MKTDVLIHSLKNGKVTGAGLDVLENENLDSFNAKEKEEFETLIAMDSVLITPHIAGWSFQSRLNINQMVLDGIRDFLEQS